MSKTNNNDRFSYGIIIVIFGILFLLNKMNILAEIPYGSNLITIGSLFLIAGITFIATQPQKVLGWVFTGIGIILNADIFFGWMQNYSRYIVPLALIIGGIVMVLTSKKK